MLQSFGVTACRVAFAIAAVLLAGSALPSSARAGGSEACTGSRFPAPWCTGVPAGVTFQRTIRGDFTARTPRQLIDRWHITGSLVIEAPGVVVRRSRIDDSVLNDTDDIGANSFTISDSTVGPARCGAPIDRPMGLGIARYTAVRVRVRGHEDGFRAGGPNVTIRDSYYKACVKPGAHADGVQDYPAAHGLVIDHNTFDMSHLTDDFTAPIFVHSDDTVDVRIVNNLALGGVFSVFLKPLKGRWVVRGNRVASGTWAFKPFDASGHCDNVGEWVANNVVRVDRRYRILSKVRTVGCPG